MLRLLPFQLRNSIVMLLLRAIAPLSVSARHLERKLKRKWRRKYRLGTQYLAIKYSGLFDHTYYGTAYPDVREKGRDPIWHYVKNGAAEGRDPSPTFSTIYYLRRYADVARSGQNPLAHYVLHGFNEGRQTSASGGLPDPSRSLLEPSNVSPLGPPRDVAKARTAQRTRPGSGVLRRYTLPLLDKFTADQPLSGDAVTIEHLQLAHDTLARAALQISVIIPTWNRATVIATAVNSALKQSYPPLEIIVVDDGSTDGTQQQIEASFEEEIRQGRVRYVATDHHGVATARNRGLERARGNLVAYLDSDNTWHEHYLLLMAALFAHDETLCTAHAASRHHDRQIGTFSVCARPYDRERLLQDDYIDLNVFMHKRDLCSQFGGFNPDLSRLAEWDFILRYTKLYEPAFLPVILADYVLDRAALSNIRFLEPLDRSRKIVHRLHCRERLQRGLEPLRIGYFIYDYPALSQTFVMSELRWLERNGFDVVVYFAKDPDKACEVDFDIPAFRVRDANHLAMLLVQHGRTLCHSHFIVPGVSKFLHPACQQAGIPFTFMPHAVDIFVHSNKKTNNISQVSRDPLCRRVFVYGDYHRRYLEDCGVPREKIAYNFQAVDLSEFARPAASDPKIGDWTRRKEPIVGMAIGRFIEKKGFDVLIQAAAQLRETNVVFEIYGYGPLEPEFAALIAELGLTNVRLNGPLVGGGEVAAAYQRADFLVAPCVVASNGDMDGFPTVILEAMAAGRPVIASAISAVPDYLADGVTALLAPSNDAEALADTVRKLIAMPTNQKVAMRRRAKEFLHRSVGTEQTMKVLLDEWLGATVDIFTVTFNREGYDDRRSTFEIIDRILARTTSNFTLTIVDNGSERDFVEQLKDKAKGRENVRLLLMNQNLFVGPASNIALAHGEGEFAIYVCSKEGFVKRHGWDRVVTDYMQAHPDVAIGGHISFLPKHVSGREYEDLQWFDKFRNQEFVKKFPNKCFGHVQGGIFIVRRDALLECGGFNPLVPHNGTDIELSYCLEGLGHKLGEIAELPSITTRTLPGLKAYLDENTVAAHPLTIDSVTKELDQLDVAVGCKCNICGWRGRSFEETGHEQAACPKCGSTGFGRAVYRLLAGNWRLFRDLKCAILSSDASLEKAAHGWFSVTVFSRSVEDFDVVLAKTTNACIIVDSRLAGDGATAAERLSRWRDLLSDDGIIIASEPVLEAGSAFDLDEFAPIARLGEMISLSSAVSAFDWRRLWLSDKSGA
jgi:glycosyltransferase involved in cell wall biosynthesis